MTSEEGFVDDWGGSAGFYNSTIHGQGKDGADGSFSEIENEVAPILRRIVQTETLNGLSTELRGVVLRYVVRHLARTPSARDLTANITEHFGLASMAARMGASPQDLFAGLARVGPEISLETLHAKHWILLQAPENIEFTISDEWLAFDNFIEQYKSNGEWTNTGISVPGTSIRLPLSPKLCLYLVCPYSPIMDLTPNDPSYLHVQDAPNLLGDSWMPSMRIGQLCAASRYVYSRTQDFALETSFLRENPYYSMPPQNRLFEFNPMRIPKMNYTTSDLGRNLARLALGLDGGDDERSGMIDSISRVLGVPTERVETEYVALRIYVIETAIQTLANESANGKDVLEAFGLAISKYSAPQRYGPSLLTGHQARVAVYDAAWQDPRKVGVGTAMASALATQLGRAEDLLEVIPLWLACSALLVETAKYLRRICIIG